jgi:hypothetical protein
MTRHVQQSGFDMIHVAPGILQQLSNHCSDMQCCAWKIKVDTLSIFLNLQKAITETPCLKTHTFIKFVLYRIDSPSVHLAVHFL